jgi:hypothetical protein
VNEVGLHRTQSNRGPHLTLLQKQYQPSKAEDDQISQDEPPAENPSQGNEASDVGPASVATEGLNQLGAVVDSSHVCIICRTS